MSETGFIKWLRDIRLDDVPRVGGKTASLGEMYQALRPQGVPIPNGFAITTVAYRHLLDHGAQLFAALLQGNAPTLAAAPLRRFVHAVTEGGGETEQAVPENNVADVAFQQFDGALLLDDVGQQDHR